MFYIEKDSKIVLYDDNRTHLVNTLAFMPQYQGLEIKETDRPIVNNEWADTEEFKLKQAQLERERLDSLTLTAADVERALYKARGMDFEDILELVENNSSVDIKALKIELKANNFYRANPYISQIGNILGYSSADLDYLFENKELPDVKVV